jgi:subtilase family serine protease
MELRTAITSVDFDPAVTQLGGTGNLTPLKVVQAYDMPDSTGSGVKIGVVSLGGGWLDADFDRSMADLGLSSLITSANIRTVSVGGASTEFDGGDGSLENTLDLYCVAAVAPKADISIYIANRVLGSPGPNYGWPGVPAGFAGAIAQAVSDNCDIIIICWGFLENSFIAGFLFESVLADAVAKGITVMVATGDFGSMATGYSNFVSIQYPASSANVVAVGGTNLLLYPNGSIQSETASELSGGGVSNFVELPVWQSGLSYTAYSNVPGQKPMMKLLTSRGIPDIAGPMNYYDFYFDGNIQQISGTSAATPVLAGAVARIISLNGQRPKQLNPLFYKNKQAFYDLPSGNNASWIDLGYAATPSWDAVTGLGRPIGSAFYSLTTTPTKKIKTADNLWTTIANTWVKTDSTTWKQVQTVWAKTVNGWQQTY